MREAIILAGGLGTRLHSVTNNLIPKPMVLINEIPFIDILVSYLVDNNFSRIIISVSHLSEVLINHFSLSDFNVEIIFSVDSEQLGTGGAIKNALKKSKNDYTYVFNGDTFANVDFKSLDKKFHESNHSFLLSIYKVFNNKRYGIIFLDDNKLRFTNSPTISSGYINIGLYILNSNIFSNFNEVNFSFEKDYLEKQEYLNNFSYYLHEGIFIDIGVPEDYKIAQNLLVSFSPKTNRTKGDS